MKRIPNWHSTSQILFTSSQTLLFQCNVESDTQHSTNKVTVIPDPLLACEANKVSPLTVSILLTVVLDCIEKVLVCCQFVLPCVSRVLASCAGVFCTDLLNSYSELSFGVSLTFNGPLVLILWSLEDGVKNMFLQHCES